MLPLSQTVGYAVLAMGYIASKGGRWVRSDEIGACTGVPGPYLRKFLNTLSKSGLIRGKRSSRGGFVLARPADEISLADVAEAIETTKRKSDCLLGLPGCCEGNPCPTRSFWKKKQAEIEDYLRRVTIAEVAGVMRAADAGLLTCYSPGDDASEGRQGEQTTLPPGRKDVSAPQERTSDSAGALQRTMNWASKVA
ncbi:MAG: RrF2 family transcriptional regulator [Planctomycetota bacterium]|jgi:Rrf2 family protein